MNPLQSEIEGFVVAGASADRDAVRAAFARLRDALSSGQVRAAEPDGLSPTGWRVNTWVKQGILLGFRFGDLADVSMDHNKWPFYDKDTLPLRKPWPSPAKRCTSTGMALAASAAAMRSVCSGGTTLSSRP